MDRVTARPSASAWKPKLGPALRSLPPRRPLAMPIQSLEKDEMGQACVPFLDSRAWRRTAVVGATLVSTLGASAVMARLLEPKGFSPADCAMLALFVLLFAWVAFAFVSAIAGFVLMWRARDLEPWRPQPIIFSRTALRWFSL